MQVDLQFTIGTTQSCTEIEDALAVSAEMQLPIKTEIVFGDARKQTRLDVSEAKAVQDWLLGFEHSSAEPGAPRSSGE